MVSSFTLALGKKFREFRINFFFLALFVFDFLFRLLNYKKDNIWFCSHFAIHTVDYYTEGKNCHTLEESFKTTNLNSDVKFVRSKNASFNKISSLKWVLQTTVANPIVLFRIIDFDSVCVTHSVYRVCVCVCVYCIHGISLLCVFIYMCMVLGNMSLYESVSTIEREKMTPSFYMHSYTFITSFAMCKLDTTQLYTLAL